MKTYLVKGTVTFPDLINKGQKDPRKLTLNNVEDKIAEELKGDKINIKKDNPDKYNKGNYFIAQSYFDPDVYDTKNTKLVDGLKQITIGTEIIAAIKPYLSKKGNWKAGLQAIRIVKLGSGSSKGENPFADLPPEDIL